MVEMAHMPIWIKRIHQGLSDSHIHPDIQISFSRCFVRSFHSNCNQIWCVYAESVYERFIWILTVTYFIIAHKSALWTPLSLFHAHLWLRYINFLSINVVRACVVCSYEMKSLLVSICTLKFFQMRAIKGPWGPEPMNL